MSARTEPARRAPVVVAVVALVAALVASGLVLRDTVLDDDGVPVGETLATDELVGTHHRYEVLLPGRTLEIEAGPPVASVAAARVGGSFDDPAVRAGRDGSLIGVGWDYEVLGYGDDLPAVEVTLVAGGRRTSLGGLAEQPAYDGRTAPELSQAPDPRYVSVAGDGSDAVVEVAFDGVVQSVDLTTGEIDADLAAPLYEPTRYVGGDGDCTARAPVSRGFSADPFPCGVGLVTLAPWREDLGWVEDADHSWASVSWSTQSSYVTRVGRTDRQTVHYATRSSTASLLLDGVEPVVEEVTSAGTDDRLVDGYAVWSVTSPPTSLTVTRRILLRGDPVYRDAAAPDTRVTISDTVDLEPVDRG